jgi:hypothetical protein
MQAVWAGCVDECAFAIYTSSVLLSSFGFLLSQASARLADFLQQSPAVLGGKR